MCTHSRVACSFCAVSCTFVRACRSSHAFRVACHLHLSGRDPRPHFAKRALDELLCVRDEKHTVDSQRHKLDDSKQNCQR